MLRALLAAMAIAIGAIGMAPVANAAPYPNCKAAKADHVCGIPSTSPLYGPWLDRDDDGIGCEC